MIFWFLEQLKDSC